MRKLLCKSSSTLSLIAFAGIVVVVLVFSGPAGSLTLTRAPPRTPLVATRQKLPALPISEAGEDKRKTGSPQSVAGDPRVIEAYLGHGAAKRMAGVTHG